MKRQIRLTDSSIRNVINEVLSDYRSGKLSEEIDNPSSIPLNMYPHINNPSKEQIDADNEWSRENAFSPFRNCGDFNNELENEDIPNIGDVFDMADFHHNPTEDTYWEYNDENRNVRNLLPGYYSMMAQSDDPETAEVGMNQMPTQRETFLDKIISENINKFLKKNNKNKS